MRISHMVATKLGMKLCNYVVTEAGFGSDLGAEKFLDIKCREAGIRPNAIVIVATIKALKYNAGIDKDNINKENIDAVKSGLCNLEAHIDNMLKYTDNVMVTLNKYDTDTLDEIEVVKTYVNSRGLRFSVNTSYSDGGDGAIDLANNVIELCDTNSEVKLLYDDELSIKDKIEVIVREIYHANEIEYMDGVLDKISKYEELGYFKYPVCIAKTQYSLSDDPKKLGSPSNYKVSVRDVNIYTGAGFVVVYLGDIMTMPGLSREPNYMGMDIDSNYNIVGLS